MPVPSSAIRQQKNLWVAAGDGDLGRVTELIEGASMSPNAPDPFSYTPMHAAASYAQTEVLDYLISRGGDVNVTDLDGDTPLYTVESVEMARYLVERGAVVDRRNAEGISPVEHLLEDFPEAAAYLQTLVPPQPASGLPASTSSALAPSEHAQHMVSDVLTDSLMAQVQDIMRRAETEGRDPEEELRRAVGETVLEGMVAGYGLSEDRGAGAEDGARANGTASKRPRTEED